MDRSRLMGVVAALAVIAVPTACGGGGDGGSGALAGVSGSPPAGVLRAALSRDGSELLHTWGSDLLVADTSGEATGEASDLDSSLFDADDVSWFDVESLGIGAGTTINTVQTVDDGTLAYTTIDDSAVVVQVDRAGSELRRIELPDGGRNPHVSSGGDAVYWIDSSSGDGLRLMRRPLDGGTDSVVFEYGFEDTFGGYDVSADGERLAYTFGSAGGVSHLFVAASDGSGATEVAEASWAPRIVGDDVLVSIDAGLDDDSLPLQQVAVVPLAGGEPTVLTDDRLQKGAVLGRLPDGRVLYVIRSYGYENVFGITAPAS